MMLHTSPVIATVGIVRVVQLGCQVGDIVLLLLNNVLERRNLDGVVFRKISGPFLDTETNSRLSVHL
jgi:hypothetical protein